MGDSPHIVHLITHLGKGGAAANVLLSCMGLCERGYRISLLHGPHPSVEENLIQLAQESGVEFHPLVHVQRDIQPSQELKAIAEIRSILKSIAPSLLHTHQSKAGVLGRWVGRRIPHLPVVHTPHGHVFYGYFSPVKTKFFVAVERQAARWCDRLIGLTQQEVEDHLARRIGNRSQWRVVHSGVPVEDIEELSRPPIDYETALGIPRGSRLLVSLGRLEPVKGFSEFLDYLAPILKETPNFHWVILGEGREREEIETKIGEHCLADRIHLVGWVENPYPWLAPADALVVPSRNEGMGRVVVEAFAMGKPVLASSVGSLPELIPNTRLGRLFDWGSPRKVGGVVREFLSSIDETDIHRMARTQTARRYSVSRMVQGLEDCYREMLEQP